MESYDCVICGIEDVGIHCEGCGAWFCGRCWAQHLTDVGHLYPGKHTPRFSQPVLVPTHDGGWGWTDFSVFFEDKPTDEDDEE